MTDDPTLVCLLMHRETLPALADNAVRRMLAEADVELSLVVEDTSSRERTALDAFRRVVDLDAWGGVVAAEIPVMVGMPVPGVPDPFLFIAETVKYMAVVAFVMALPAIAIRVEDYPRVRWLQRVLPFRRRRVRLDAVDNESELIDD